LHGRSAYLGGGGEAVEEVALGGKQVGEVAGVTLLFKPIAGDHLAGGEPTVESVSGAIQVGLTAGGVLVETADDGSNVGFPPVMGVDLPLCPHGGFLAAGTAIPPTVAIITGELGLLARVASLGKIPDRPPSCSCQIP
jgi:hypothetical protein